MCDESRESLERSHRGRYTLELKCVHAAAREKVCEIVRARHGADTQCDLRSEDYMVFSLPQVRTSLRFELEDWIRRAQVLLCLRLKGVSFFCVLARI